jgi:methyl-accepting chemotaxis protein
MFIKRVIDNLRVKNKLLILGGIVLLALVAPLAAYLQSSGEAIAFTARESSGIEPSRQLLRAVQSVQHHRALSMNATDPQRAAKQTEAGAALAHVSTLFKARGDAAITTAWDSAITDWKAIEQAAAAPANAGEGVYERHTALIAKLLEVLDLNADDAYLTLDPEADGYHLMAAALIYMPQLTESLAQADARGVQHLTQGAIKPEARASLAALLDAAQTHQRNFTRAAGKAMAASPAVKLALGGVVAENQRLTDQALRLTREQVIAPESLSYAAAEYHRVYTQITDAQFKLNDAALSTLSALLEERISVQRRNQLAVVAAMLLFTLLAGWIGYAVANSITRPLGQAVGMAQRFTSGDLTGRSNVLAKNEMGRLFGALEGMRNQIASSVSEIRAVADSVDMASAEISTGNSDLSRRTEQQAATLEETASSMVELTTTVKQNAGSAQQASVLAKEASAVASRGGEAVRGVVSTMKGISESSNKIADIIGVIDSIAFQTNILALNAAVEAARAGEQGRGFAVVASEVRSLAQRSAQAAKEIKGLIQESAGRVGSGVRQVEDAGKTMDEIVASANSVSGLVAEIARASAEQLTGIEQVDRAVSELEGNTHQNAAVVEQAAAAAEQMARQAQVLVAYVGKFKLEEGAVGEHVEPEDRAPMRVHAAPAKSPITGVSVPSRASLVVADHPGDKRERVSMHKPQVSQTPPTSMADNRDEWKEF